MGKHKKNDVRTNTWHIGLLMNYPLASILCVILFFKMLKDVHNVSVNKKIHPMDGHILDTEFCCFFML